MLQYYVNGGVHFRGKISANCGINAVKKLYKNHIKKFGYVKSNDIVLCSFLGYRDNIKDGGEFNDFPIEVNLSYIITEINNDKCKGK